MTKRKHTIYIMRRYSFHIAKETLEHHFDFKIETPVQKSYQIVPRQAGAVILNQDPTRIRYFNWGLIPADSKDGINDGRLINARMETISSQPSFRMPIREKRCLILADSYYEWNDTGLKKYPYRVVPHNKSLLVIAGIWDTWKSGEFLINSFSAITTKSNGMVNKIASRMPAILTTKKEQMRWLSDLSLSESKAMLIPPKEDYLNVYRITEKANNSKYNAPDLHKEVAVPLNIDPNSKK